MFKTSSPGLAPTDVVTMDASLKLHEPMPRRGTKIPASGAVKIEQRRSDTIEWALFWTFIAGLAWVPFLYASNERIAWGINAVLFCGLAAIFEVSLLMRGQSHPVGIKQLRVPAALFVAVVFWIIIQNATWTPSFMHHPIWAMTADALGKPVAGSISVNRDLTALALIAPSNSRERFLDCCSALPKCVAGQFFRSRHCRHCCWVFCLWSGVIRYGRREPFTIGWEIRCRAGFVTSTFYDRNHFATYAGIGLVVMFGLILRLYGHALTITDGSFRFKMASIIDVTGQRGAVLLAGAFLILVAILLTWSRGGLIATGLGLLTLGVLWLGGRNLGSTGKRAIFVFGIFLRRSGGCGLW